MVLLHIRSVVPNVRHQCAYLKMQNGIIVRNAGIGNILQMLNFDKENKEIIFEKYGIRNSLSFNQSCNAGPREDWHDDTGRYRQEDEGTLYDGCPCSRCSK